MTKKEREREIKRRQEFAEELANDKGMALRLLVGAGIMTPEGKLCEGCEDIMFARELGKKRYG